MTIISSHPETGVFFTPHMQSWDVLMRCERDIYYTLVEFYFLKPNRLFQSSFAAISALTIGVQASGSTGEETSTGWWKGERNLVIQ